MGTILTKENANSIVKEGAAFRVRCKSDNMAIDTIYITYREGSCINIKMRGLFAGEICRNHIGKTIQDLLDMQENGKWYYELLQ